MKDRLCGGEQVFPLLPHYYLLLSLSEYETGVKNAPDVLSASQRILDNKRRSADIRKDYWVIKAKLMALKGK